MSDETKERATFRREYDSLPLSEEDASKVRDLREVFSRHASYIEQLCPEGRYRSIVMTKLEEAAMFATKAISHK